MGQLLLLQGGVSVAPLLLQAVQTPAERAVLPRLPPAPLRRAAALAALARACVEVVARGPQLVVPQRGARRLKPRPTK